MIKKLRRGRQKASYREIGGKRHYFRSRWDANIARWLEWRKCRGEIIDWAYEPETFWFEAIRRGVRSYKPDFRIETLPDQYVYLEVKGWLDTKSQVALRRMKRYHPHIVLELLDSEEYKLIERSVKAEGFIPDWEFLNA